MEKTEAHFASWLGLCPDNRVSGDKVLRRGTRHVVNRAANGAWSKGAAKTFNLSVTTSSGTYKASAKLTASLPFAKGTASGLLNVPLALPVLFAEPRGPGWRLSVLWLPASDACQAGDCRGRMAGKLPQRFQLLGRQRPARAHGEDTVRSREFGVYEYGKDFAIADMTPRAAIAFVQHVISNKDPVSVSRMRGCAE